MKTSHHSAVATLRRMAARRLVLLRAGLCLATVAPIAATAQTVERHSAAIPLDQIGAAAEKQYKSGGLGVSAMDDGARLLCMFQKLEGRATNEGLWLTSTETASQRERFRVIARAIGRADTTRITLREIGAVRQQGSLVRFVRPGVHEEYSVSMDGVRQDFLILDRPSGGGEVRLDLAVDGARAEALAHGARLMVDGSGRKIAYTRLRATDATGRELPARIEVASNARLAIVVDDSGAAYPIRIDPTFSDEDWIGIGMSDSICGANSFVYAAVTDDSGNLYIGGSFTFVGDVAAKGIAKWNGSAWSALGSGLGDTARSIVAVAVSGSNLYAGGSFTTAGGVGTTNIARWDGSTWSALGSGMNSNVFALAVSGTNLYAGGHFTNAGGIAANRIAKWNGTSWSALGDGMDSAVFALAVSGTNLYAGGYFTNAGGVAANRIAKWNDSSWSALAGGMNSTVNALAVSGTNLYAGGYFTSAGGIAAANIARWDGTAWFALGSGTEGQVRALSASGTDLYVGGYFPAGSGHVAKWNGSAWSALGSGLNQYVEALTVSGTNLYVGGHFLSAGGKTANYVASWNGTAWSALGSGLSGQVDALAVSESNVYVGGYFKMPGAVVATNIAKWDGSAWSPLGSEAFTGRVYALVTAGPSLYAGGSFIRVGTNVVNQIAKWNGTSWSALAGGMDNAVFALALSDSNLYAGGAFTTAGDVGATNIAKWDGTKWSALGFGVRGFVHALAVSGSNVYAGGDFTSAGGFAVNRIAKWDGTSWSALGSGIANAPGSGVYALATSGTDLYAGGYFDAAGGNTANNIAKWDGTSWSALGSGLDRQVHALVLSGTTLYAGGRFITAGGKPASRIARWDGTEWSALGSGVDDYVYALAGSSTTLYAGGYFAAAGGKRSIFTAQANLPSGPEIIVQRPAGAALTDAASTVDFGTVGVGSSNAMTFTIRNTGTTNLTGLAVSQDGGNSGDFAVEALATTYLPPGARTTLNVFFSPSAAGARAAAIHIASNDDDENPFDIELRGTGLTALESWRLQHFDTTENLGDAANEADPEGDGVENIKEYAFGLNPKRSDLDRLPLPARVGGNLTVTFTEPSGVDGIIYGAEVSTDLVHWNPVADAGSGTIHVFTGEAGSSEGFFMRLTVTAP